MSKPPSHPHAAPRILIVDDNPSVHDAFDRILRRDNPGQELDEDESLLFGETKKAPAIPDSAYEVDHAISGQEAIDKIRVAQSEKRPYQVAFVDIRMPGMDGVKTIEHIWEIDQKVQTVICTAYADYRWRDLTERFGQTDRLLVLKKPFHDIEVMQLASTLTQKWTLARQAALKLDQMEALAAQRAQKLIEFQNREQQHARDLDQARLRTLLRLSQEFRTPLTMLLNLVDQITSGAALDATQQEAARRNIESLLALLDDALLIRRAENENAAVDAKPCDVVAFLRGLLEGFSACGKQRGIEWHFSAAVSSRTLQIDANRLEKALFPLLDFVLQNAADNSRISALVEGQTDAVGFQISLPPPLRPDLTAPHEDIALLFAREILRRINSALILEKNEALGLRIVVNLRNCPLVKSPSPTPAELDSETEPDEKRPQLLMAGESAELRSFVREGLGLDFHFTETGGSEEIMTIARESVPDLIIIDFDGFRGEPIAACARLKSDQVTSHIPLVLLGANISESSQLRALEAGVDDCLDKPFRLPLLKARIGGLLENRRKLHERFHGSSAFLSREIASSQIDAEFLDRVAEIVEANLSDCDFEVETLGRRLGISRRQLFRKFKAVAGCTPNVFIREIRLKRAARLLEESRLTISEVIYAVGFSDPKHFRTVFRDRFGVLPGEYGKKPAA